MILSSPIRMRIVLTGLAMAVALSVTPTGGALARHSKAKAVSSHTKGKKASAKHRGHRKSKKHAGKPEASGHGKATQIGTYGDWGAYKTEGKSKTCYALAEPETREPHSMKREAAYMFISDRPAENVRNEVSIIMGFPMRDGAEGKAEIDHTKFDLIAKGSNAWIKNPAEEGHLIEAMKKGKKMIVKAANRRGKVTTDTYSLHGVTQALDTASKECR